VQLFAYGGTFRAKADRREELVSALLQTADLMRSIPDCVEYIIGQSEDDPNEIRVLAVWTSKEAHDQAENHPGVRKFIVDALPMLDGKPSGERWIVRGGKGVGQ
jgi:quinol monooxygenase YgiN